MGTEISRRTYRKRRRAEQEEQTRLKITEAAVKLHGTVGPARTTIAGVATVAGVQRATVYRHFPDLESLFSACSAHWASQNTLPSPEQWRRIADPDDRLRHALAELYEWYALAEPMLTNVTRDAPLVPACAATLEGFSYYFESMHEALMAGRRARGRARARVAGAIGHALAFPTWQSLVREQGLTPKEAVALMSALAGAAAGTAAAGRGAAG